MRLSGAVKPPAAARWSRKQYRNANPKAAGGGGGARRAALFPAEREPAMKKKTASPNNETIAKAKLLYDSGVTPIPEILALLEMSAAQFHTFRVRNGWPLRARFGRPKADVETKGATPKRHDGSNVRPISPEREHEARIMIARLEDAVAREFARAEAALAKYAPKSSETSARTLSSLVKTLAELKRMRRDGKATETAKEAHDDADEVDDDAPPRNLAELRAELARRLERLQGEQQAG